MSEIFVDDVRSHLWESGNPSWSQRHADGADLIFLAGELDLATAADLHRLLTDATTSSTAPTIVLDLSDVTFIDAHSISLIMAAQQVATGRGRQLRIVGLHGTPAMVFDVLGLAATPTCPSAADENGRGPRG
ncbi:STAS domain-containing protein [Luedemannella flava]|uniref:STAS domain-containing protein n=1 Tax=Luedemannella flava TaxID=349316 RepID=A0ABN2MF17_9ACTN